MLHGIGVPPGFERRPAQIDRSERHRLSTMGIGVAGCAAPSRLTTEIGAFGARLAIIENLDANAVARIVGDFRVGGATTTPAIFPVAIGNAGHARPLHSEIETQL
ncbi:MAG: hypothetical protein QM608_01570 [Caulobacter sp.]